MIEAPTGKKKWERKARALELRCHCRSCLSEAGITPDNNAHMSFRTDITGNIYSSANGLITGKIG